MKKTFTRIFLATAMGALAAPGVFAVDHLLIIGEATPGGYSINDGLYMVQDATNPDVFRFTGWLEGNKDFKLTAAPGFDNPELEYRNASETATDISSMVTGDKGDDRKFQVTESANYNIIVNVANLTISATKAEYQDSKIRYNVLFVIGNATSADWSLEASIPMYASETNPFLFELRTELKANGTDNGEFKVLGNTFADWGGPWFHPYYEEAEGQLDEASIDYSRLTDNNSHDVKWLVKPGEEGTYDLSFNIKDMTFNKTHVDETTGISNVSTSEAVSTYYDLRGIRLTSAPARGTICIEVRADGTARKVRF